MEPQDTSTRELTVDEAVSIAIVLQQNDQLAAAAEVFRQVLDVQPDHADALHYAGVLAHQQGHSDEAVALVQRSVAMVPGRADYHNNLGIVLQAAGRLDAAISAYRRAIAIEPSHANAFSNLGVLLKATGKLAEAEAAYRSAIRLNPAHVDAYTNLGILLNSRGATEEAAACYCKVITLRPAHSDARRLLALAHCTLGEIDRAVQIFEDWLREEPDDPVARHMHAACTGRDVPPRASNAFVETTFDRFAATFESKLQRLAYRAPALVGAMLEDSGLVASKQLDVLDAGCGTGLCGSMVAPYARRLVGIDLSAGMLEHARAKKVYDELVKVELTAFLLDRPQTFDLIVSADTLVYAGELEPVVAAAAIALRPGGLMIFTLEHACGGEHVRSRLEVHGRYSHSATYVHQVLAAAGLRSEIEPAELRMEAGLPVAGLVVRALKCLVAACAVLCVFGVSATAQTLNAPPRDVIKQSRDLLQAEVAAIFDESRHAVDGRTFRISYQPDGPGPEILMAGDGRPRFIRSESGRESASWTAATGGSTATRSEKTTVQSLVHYTRTPARACDGTPRQGELVLDYENDGSGWTVTARTNSEMEVNGAAFDMLAGSTAVTAGPMQQAGARSIRPFTAPFKLPDGVLGGPPPGTTMSLWLDTESLLPVRWSLAVPATPEQGIPAIPDIGVIFTYLDAVVMQVPAGVQPPDCLR